MKQKNWLHWIDEKNIEQQKWACKYLDDRGIRDIRQTPYSAFISLYGSLMFRSNGLVEDALPAKFVKKMRNAWYQEKLRSKRTNSTNVNFLLSNRAKNELDILAKASGVSLSATLECLIIDRQGHEKTHKATIADIKKRHQEACKKLGEARRAAVRAAKEIRDQLDICLFEVSRLAIVLKEAGPVTDQPGNYLKEAQQMHRQLRSELARSEALTTARMIRLMTPFLDLAVEPSDDLSIPQDRQTLE